MKRMLLLTTAMLLVASSAMAAMENARFALHRKDKFSSTKAIPNQCDNASTPAVEPNYSPNFDNVICDNYTVTAPVPAASTVYVVIGYLDAGITAASFGVTYTGTHTGAPGSGIDPTFISWFGCNDGLQFPNNDGVHGDFPQPGGGIRLTWTQPTCANQTVNGIIHAVVGSFYIYAYSDDVLRLTENLNLQSGPELAVANCAGSTTVFEDILPANIIQQILGRVQFGAGSEGYTPCGAVPTRPSTWGKIKNQYQKD